MLDKNTKMHELYTKAYKNTAQSYIDNQQQDEKSLIKKLIFYGVKAVNTKKDPEYIIREEVEKDFELVNILQNLMATLTPREFMNIFPVEKEYEGHKFGMKDYFYTQDYIKGLDLDKPIKEEILHFIWEYHNRELTNFNVQIMEYISRLRKLDGKTSLADEFANMMGLETFSLHSDDQGREYLISQKTGKTLKVRKPRSRYLKVVK